MTSGTAAAIGIAIGTAVAAGAVRSAAASVRMRRTGCGFWGAYACTWTNEPLLGMRAGTWWAIVSIVGAVAFLSVPVWLLTR